MASSDGSTAVARYDVDPELLSLVMRPYRLHCRYLKSAVAEVVDSCPTARGDFEIGDSCYIDDTGHFNSVEFNICYNQLAYYLIAKSVKEGLISEFGTWTLEDFWRLQLPNILITRFSSSFKQQMRGKRFSGSVTLTEAVKLEKSERWNPLIVLRTSCQFWDEGGVNSRGEVNLAVTNPA